MTIVFERYQQWSLEIDYTVRMEKYWERGFACPMWRYYEGSVVNGSIHDINHHYTKTKPLRQFRKLCIERFGFYNPVYTKLQKT